jgi:hypothetical protein
MPAARSPTMTCMALRERQLGPPQTLEIKSFQPLAEKVAGIQADKLTLC